MRRVHVVASPDEGRHVYAFAGNHPAADSGLSKAQYSEMYKEASKGTKWWVTIPKAFLFGGLICVIGQSLMDMYLYLGLSKDNASMSVSITLIFLSAVFTGLGCYYCGMTA